MSGEQWRLSRRAVLGGGAALTAWLAAGGPEPALAGVRASTAQVEDGYELWLRYRLVDDAGLLARYRTALSRVVVEADGPLVTSAVSELERGLTALLGRDVRTTGPADRPGNVVLGTADGSPTVRRTFSRAELDRLGPEGYAIRSVPTRTGRVPGPPGTVIAGGSERGLLYGAFHLLRLVQTHHRVDRLDVVERPAAPMRMLNHWDNLDRTVERGYAGLSIFHWDELPELEQRYTDYARTLASVGINATVVNNVNANPEFLSSDRLPGLAALATVLRRWGIAFYLSANYASPMVLTRDDDDPITVADPFDERVRSWWSAKIDEIYEQIPDLGGFLVKANSEGQPGPLDYGRTHADGANMLARRLAPHGGTLVWRSFVHEGFSDWAEYEYKTFAPLDGDFDDNVVVQTKNGPIDFQVREPVNPLFGALPRTNQMIELQITQEYTGHATHLCYLVPEWKEVLDFDTEAQGPGTTVAAIVDGTAYDQERVGFAGVSNFGSDRNWTGYLLGAANAHGFARLAWDPTLSADAIAREWTRMTFGNDPVAVDTVTALLTGSWRTYEAYTSPLGMGYLTYPLGAHFTPDPRSTLNLSHYTTAEGTGFDRTAATGTGYTGLYADRWARTYEDLATCPDELLLFMHWVPYAHRLHSGKTVIQHIYDSHFDGLEDVRGMVRTWQGLRHHVDPDRHAAAAGTFDDHLEQARLWRDTIVSFFFEFSRLLDEHRSWYQLDLAGSGSLVLGGWPNRLDVAVTNATPAAQTITGELVAPDGWQTSPGSVRVASTETGSLPLVVQPPLAADLVPLSVALDTELETLGAAGRTFVLAPAGRRCHLALDAGTAGSPLVPGYQRLTRDTAWDPARGFGWLTRPQERDRGAAWDALRRDFCGDYPAHTLRIALPPGPQQVSLLVGDGGPRSYPTFVNVDGTRVAESPALEGGEFTWIHFPLDGGGSGRVVDLELDSVPDQFWHLCALVIIDPDSTLPDIVVTDASTEPVWFAGRDNAISVTAVNTSADRDVPVTVTLDLPDGWSAEPVQQVLPAGASATITATGRPPATPALGSVRVRVTAEGAVEDGEHDLDVVAVPNGADVPLALDAGSATSPVLDSFDRLAPEHSWDEASGFGWVGAVPDQRDRARMDVLRRDLVLGRDQTYVLRLAVPPGPHVLHVLTGDAYAPSGQTTVLEDGRVLGSSGAEIIDQAHFLWFDVELDGGPTGRTADLELRGALRDRYWRVVALVMQGA